MTDDVSYKLLLNCIANLLFFSKLKPVIWVIRWISKTTRKTWISSPITSRLPSLSLSSSSKDRSFSCPTAKSTTISTSLRNCTQCLSLPLKSSLVRSLASLNSKTSLTPALGRDSTLASTWVSSWCATMPSTEPSSSTRPCSMNGPSARSCVDSLL